jgi:hypothetical protein
VSATKRGRVVRFVAVFLCVCVCFAGRAYGGEAEAKALAREFLVLNGTVGTIDYTISQMVQPMVQRLKQTEPDKAAAFERNVTEASAKYKSAWLEDLEAYLAKSLTEKELIDLCDFYRSAIGKKMLTVMSAQSKEFAAIGQKHSMQLIAFLAMAGGGIR